MSKNKKRQLLKLRELKEDLEYLKSNESHVIKMRGLFQTFREDRYRNEKNLAVRKIEIYEVLLKEIYNLFDHMQIGPLIYEEKLKRVEDSNI